MLLVCPHCGTKNRVAPDTLQNVLACGSCRADLLPAAPMVIADAAFERFIASTELPVVVDFWAAWCGPCKAMAPQFENVARALPLVRFVKVDTDAAPLASAKYNIRSIPSLLLFEGGKEKARITGSMSAQDLKAWLHGHLSLGSPL